MTTKQAADLQPGDIFVEGQGTETVTRVEELGPHAVIVHVEGREYGTFARAASFEIAECRDCGNTDLMPPYTDDKGRHFPGLYCEKCGDTTPEPEQAVDRSHALHARPKAGAPAANQYGVFQVRYASEKQTAYIKALMDRKDLSKTDPKKVDVAALREQVANTQVNKKAASAIIDTLLALPDAAPNPAPAQGRPATDKQKDFVRTLLAEREGHGNVEAIRARLNEARESGHLTAPFVSEMIALLLEIPTTAKVEVPAGRYALPAEDSHFVFYKVDRPTEGKWAGYVFVKQLIGSVGSWDEQRLSRQASENVLSRIAADPEEAARMFGIKARACGMCASPLSNARSRAAGYGETCAANHGFFYPTEEEALAILDELEADEREEA